MREAERLDNIHVIVDSSKVIRCRWCGVMESENWALTPMGAFCSQECRRACFVWDNVKVFMILAAVGLCFLVVLWPVPLYAVPAFLVFLMLGLPSLIYSRKGMIDRRLVPKDSRANDVPLDTALLATVTTSVACPRCDAELDLRIVGTDRVYACAYCGATGTVSIIDRSQQARSNSGRSV